MSVDGPDIRCLDCATPLLPGGREAQREWFMVRDDVWSMTGLPATGGHYLCVQCTAARIGRDLEPGDFTDDPINQPTDADSPRMHALKTAAALARSRGEA